MDVAIFDMDGTLIDSMPGLTDLAVDVIHRHFHLHPGIARHEYLRTAGRPFSEQLEAIFPGHEARPSRVVAASVYEKEKREVTLAAPTFPAIVKELQRHRARNHATVLVSSTVRSLVDEVLSKRYIAGEFTHVYGYLGQDKEAQIYEFLAHVSPTPITGVYYGDTDEDFRISKIFGMDFMRVNRDGSIA